MLYELNMRDMKLKGREEGLKEGIVLGREEGLEEGMQKGREEGRKTASREATDKLVLYLISQNQDLSPAEAKEMAVNILE